MTSKEEFNKSLNKKLWLWLIIAFIVLINFYNIFYVAIFNYTNSTTLLIILPAVKDLFLMMLCTFSFLLIIVNVKWRVTFSLFPIYGTVSAWIFVILFYAIISKAPFSYILYNIRMSVVLFITFVLFSSMNYDFEEARINRILSIVCLIVVVFGFVEYMMPTSFWNDIIGLKKYAQNRFLGGTEVDRSYSSDLYFLLGRPVRRMMSFYAEPVTFGSFVTFFFSYFMFCKEHVLFRKLQLTLLFFAGLLVFSKLFIASLFIVLGYKFILRRPYFFPLILISVALFVLSGYLHAILGKIHGSFSHFFGFFTGITMLSDYPFGFGLGMAGNRGVLEHKISMGEFGGESGLGNMTAQMGIFGFILLVTLLLIMNQFKKRATRSSSYFGLFVAFFAYIINFYLSFASLGMSGNIMFFIIGGIFLNPRMKLVSYD